MNRWNPAVAVALAASLAACSGGDKRSDNNGAQPPASAASAAPVAGTEAHSSTAAPETAGAYTVAPETTAPQHAATERVVPAPRTGRATTSHGTPSRTASRPAEPPRRTHPVDRIDQPIADEPPSPRETERADRTERTAEANRDRLSIPAGTELRLVLENGLGSATSREGDPVTARVERASGPDGRVLLPGGTVVKGRVYRAEASGRVQGRAHLGVEFKRIVVRGVEHDLEATAIEVEGPDSHGRDAAIVGGSTVGGAILGAILDGGNGAKKGAVIGVLGGTGAVLATRGHDVELPAGSRWTVRVKGGVRVD